MKIESSLSSIAPGKMKVLAIVPSSFCFGLQNLTLSFFGALKGRVDAHFIVTVWNDGDFPKRVDALGYSRSMTWLGMFSRSMQWNHVQMSLHALVMLPLGWWHVLRQIQKHRPDVIYLANHHEIILLLPILVWWRSKVVVHMHDPPPAILFQRASFFVWRRAVGRFLFISRSVRDRTAQIGSLGQCDQVVHNGVPISPLVLPRFRHRSFLDQFGWPEDAVIVGLSGQMTPTKGHQDFIDAALIVVQGQPCARFVIGGKPFEPFCSELKAKIAAHDLESRFGFTGWLPTSQAFYEGLDVFVLASRHEEGFGLVVAEAMERGCAVVATRSGGASEIVEDGRSALLVPKNDPRGLAAAITRLTINHDERRLIAAEGRARVEKFFDLSRQAEEFLGRLSEAAGAARR